MKRLLTIVLFTIGCVVAMARTYDVAEVPNVQIENRYRFTSNPDGILSTDAVARIDSICYTLRDSGIAQVAVVAIDDIEGDDVFDFAYKLFSSWGVGGKNDSGLGVILVESRREIRFITGYAVEGVLPDAICKRIQTRYMLPHFREGDYSSGMVAGMEAIDGVLRGSDLIIEEESAATEDIFAITGFILLIILGTVALVIIVYRSAHKCPNCKKIGLEQKSSQFISKSMGVATYEDTFVCKYCGGHTKRKRQVATVHTSGRRGGGGPFIGGGFGGGSFGGGRSIGGGWGGGSFGGGGAGSRW